MNKPNIFIYVFSLVFQSRKQFALLLLLIGTITLVSAAMSAIPILFAMAIDFLSAGNDPATGVSLILAFSVSLLVVSIYRSLNG